MYLLAELRSFKYFIKGMPTQSLKEFLKYFETFFYFRFYGGYLKGKSLVQVRNNKFIRFLSKKILEHPDSIWGEYRRANDKNLRVVFTINAFKGIGGVEVWLYQMALELKKRGVKLLIYTKIIGAMSERATSTGIAVTSNISEVLKFKPNLVHLHHASNKDIFKLIQTLDKRIPIFNLIHGLVPVLCQPFLDESRKVAYGAVSKLAVESTSFITGISVNKIYLLKNFSPPQNIALTENSFDRGRAAIISSKVKMSYANKWSKLFKELSIDLDFYGNESSNMVLDYSDIINQYDFFLCTGKTAIDLMGFGKQVMLLEENLLGPAVVSGNFQFLSDMNFSLVNPLIDVIELDEMGILEKLKSNISRIKINNVEENNLTLFRENSLELATDHLISIYTSMIESPNLEIN